MSESVNLSQEEDPENTFKILVATDIHLGYAEKDPIKGQDTFVTLEEILQIAVREEVDFVLLGGDLFHETKPSPYCIYKCTELLRKYCMGDRPVQIEFLSDQASNFRYTPKQVVNYEDPDLNISVPVFSIHGNHDDPTGHKQISAMDLMASTGLVNYFGKWSELTHVEIQPILLKKGDTHLALYGLSHIKDERLGRLFLDKKVTMLTPPDDVKWFNLLVWHQNRVYRGPKSFIPEDCIPEFLDLVIWGHEHDCLITPEDCQKCYISQPGSSVATSLTEGESIPKRIGLLVINKDKFVMNEIKLKTVRPFIYRQIHLEKPTVLDGDGVTDPGQEAQDLVKQEVEIMIEEARGIETVCSMLPLIRLKVFFHDERQVFNTIRFGQTYIGKVANPEEMIMFSTIRKATANRRKKTLENGETEDDSPEAFAERVEDIVFRYFTENNKLDILSVTGMNEAISKFITANDNEAPVYLVDCQVKKTFEKLKELKPDVEKTLECIQELRDQRESANTDADEARRLLSDKQRPKSRAPQKTSTTDDTSVEDASGDDDDDEDRAVAKTTSRRATATTDRPTRGPGSRGGKGSRGGRGSRAKAQS